MTPPADRAPALTRRRFLAAAAALAGGALAGPALSTRLAFGAPQASVGDVLVVLSLRGGLDGLSVVVPAGDPDYAAARPDLAIPADRLLPVDARFGLHPALGPMEPWWRTGSFGAVHAVGQPDPTRSHFQAIAAMERAAPGTGLQTGWLDRVSGLQGAGGVFATVQLGGALPALALSGPAAELAVGRLDDLVLWAADDESDPHWAEVELPRWEAALQGLHAGAPEVLAQPVTAALAALSTAARVTGTPYSPEGGAVYADTDLATALRDVARLVKADVGLRIACLEVGGWDMHEGMGDVTGGWLVDQLGGLARALAAFATDLGPRLAEVSLLTLTEFGRRVQQNGSGGTDHGHGSAMLLLGGGVVGGRVHGRWPGLAAADLDDGDLAGATDYRAVLGEVLRKRCGIGDLGTVFPGTTGLPADELGVVRTRPGSAASGPS